MTYAAVKISDNPDHLPYSENEDGIRINLLTSFVCTRIPGNPQMRFEACTARKARCDENDEQRIRNTFSECRGCPGYASMRIAAPPILEYKSRNQLSYHTKECRCCGRMITSTDQHPTFGKGICHHCKRGLIAADEMGLDQAQAVEAIKHYANAFTGKEKAGMYHNQTWAMRFEAYFQGKGVPEKVDKCSCCGRTGLTLRNKYQGRYVCSTCDYHLRKGRPFKEVGQQIGKGRFQDMSKRGRCGCCGREDLTLTRKVNGDYVCGSCDYYIRKEVQFEEVRKKMQTKFPVKGEEPEKPVVSEKKEEKYQVNVTPEVDIIPTQKRNRKDPPMMRLPITEREQPVLDWIDRLAKENRRFRNDQAWVILEWAKKQMEGEAVNA